MIAPSLRKSRPARSLGALIALGLLFALGCPTQQQISPPRSDRRGLGYVYWRNATKRQNQRSVGSVIPRPKVLEYTHGLDYLAIVRGQFQLELASDSPRLKDCAILQSALQRYSERLLFDDSAPELKDDPAAGRRRKLGRLERVRVGPAQAEGFECEAIPHAQMDESYSLVVGEEGGTASLEARTNWGLLRGLETLSQLVFKLAGADKFGFAIRPCRIEDEPRFAHRGLLLDTARHFIPVSQILRLIEAMAYNKLNVFHWHIVDDQSWPLESAAFPQLARLNAYRPGLTYSEWQIRLVMIHATLWGIRVIPELDTPGHSYPLRHIRGVLSECYDQKSASKNGDFGPIDPTKASAYETVDRLLQEFASNFPDSHFHAGGDEVDFDCWRSSPEISAWMASKNISGNYEELSNHYIRKIYHLLTEKHRKTMLVWQEVFDMGANLPRDKTLVHVWKYINDKPAYMGALKQVVDAGYQALLSSCWYLNYIDYAQDWIKFYQCDPRGPPLEAKQAQQVLGGEICMWTEFIDQSNLISRTWPRASAAAERLWSPAEANNTEEFLHRLEQHRCRLIARGVNAEPVNGPGYC